MTAGHFVEVFIDTSLATRGRGISRGCINGAKGTHQGLHGYRLPYEPPEAPELHIVNDGISPEEAAVRVIRYLQTQGYLPRQNLPTLDEA